MNSEQSSVRKFDHGTAIILGITQGVTEFLPVSSTGHMLLVENFLNEEAGKNDSAEYAEAMNSYLAAIQLGSILTAILLLHRRVWDMLLALFGRSLNGLRLIRSLLLSFAPAAFTAIFFDEILQKFLYNSTGVACAFLAGAILIFASENRYSCAKNSLTINELQAFQCLKIGLWQCLALVPGMSRSMATIAGGYFCGLARREAVEYSFLLGLVTSASATVYRLIQGRDAIFQCFTVPVFFAGIFAAFIFSILSVKIFINFLSSKGMRPFAWYRIFLGLSLFFFLSP